MCVCVCERKRGRSWFFLKFYLCNVLYHILFLSFFLLISFFQSVFMVMFMRPVEKCTDSKLQCSILNEENWLYNYFVSCGNSSTAILVIVIWVFVVNNTSLQSPKEQLAVTQTNSSLQSPKQTPAGSHPNGSLQSSKHPLWCLWLNWLRLSIAHWVQSRTSECPLWSSVSSVTQGCHIL